MGQAAEIIGVDLNAIMTEALETKNVDCDPSCQREMLAWTRVTPP